MQALTVRRDDTTHLGRLMIKLTETQRRVFDFVRDALLEGGPAPTMREISERFRWSSKRAAACHLEAIIRKGWLTSEPGKARSLRLSDSARPRRQGIAEIPLFGSIPAGFAWERGQEADECVPVTIESIGFRPTRNTFALRVSGDSMIGRHICDGDIVVLEHGPEPRPGQMVAALIDRKSTLKTFVMKGGKAFLKAENPKYRDLIPAEELMIQGIVRAVIRQFGK
jgi:repressor LexA